MENIISVHIWQLPIKDNNINKQNDYSVVHSTNTKKIKMQKLYEYFNQDDKIESVSENIQSILTDKDEEYDLVYKTFQLSLNEYENTISELQDRFVVNRNNIRNLESMSSYIDINNNNVITTLEDADSKYYNIFISFNDFYNICNSVEDLIDHNKDTIKSFENTKGLFPPERTLSSSTSALPMIWTSATSIRRFWTASGRSIFCIRCPRIIRRI